MDAESIQKLIFFWLGGFGLFRLGLKYMSDGMQAVAGETLRRIISAVTDNRLLATGVGIFVTCAVQSSTVTTILVVGFVNSAVMQLSQAVGVIMGANIGTTITGWIFALPVGKYGLPLLGVSAIVFVYARSDRWRYGAMALMGFGMIFFGLELMKDGAGLIKDMPTFESWLQQFRAETFLQVLGAVLVGCVLTILFWSSSATLGVTITLAYQGVITYETAAAMVIGENLGTTFTAVLASLGATTNARRAAYFHVMFNLIGVCWIVAIFVWYVQFIPWLIGVDVEATALRGGEQVYTQRTAAIAATHTVFNVANTLLFLPFLPIFVRLLERVVPAKAFKEKPHLTDLDLRLLQTPLMAIEQSRKEVLKMADGCLKMAGWLRTLREQDLPDEELVERLQRRERILDAVQDEVAMFITNLLSGNVPHSIAEEARRQLRMADEYESVSDYVANLLKFDLKLRKNGQRFTEKQRQDLLQLHDAVAAYLQTVNEANRQGDRNILGRLQPARREIRGLVKRLRREHLDDLSSGAIPPQVSVAFMASLNAYSRVRDHSQNIAEAVSGEK
jgi:phosphate:Na+ symporter